MSHLCRCRGNGQQKKQKCDAHLDSLIEPGSLRKEKVAPARELQGVQNSLPPTRRKTHRANTRLIRQMNLPSPLGALQLLVWLTFSASNTTPSSFSRRISVAAVLRASANRSMAACLFLTPEGSRHMVFASEIKLPSEIPVIMETSR